MARCTKHYYADQASARLGLAHVRKKARSGKKVPVRVYPCDVCDGWHLTANASTGRKTPPWDRDPNWRRPTVDGLERRGLATSSKPGSEGGEPGAAVSKRKAKVAKPALTREVTTQRLIDGKVVTQTRTEKVRPSKPRKGQGHRPSVVRDRRVKHWE